MKQLAIGCDPNAESLKQVVMAKVRELGWEPVDFGSDDPIYPNVAVAVAKAVAGGEYPRGILLCGTGIGVSIAANKVPGAYAALCSDAYSTERSRKSNNANIMCLGAQVCGPQLAETLTEIWMRSEFTPGGRSDAKVNRICEFERELLG